MNTKKIENQLNDLYKELKEVASMPGEDVCRKYNADGKGEIVASIQAEIESLQNELNEITSEDDEYDVYDDHGFANERDFNRWKHGA